MGALNDALCQLIMAMRPGPIAAETLVWFRRGAAELLDQDRGWLVDWLDRYDADRIRQPEALIAQFRREGAWALPCQDAAFLPHDLVAYTELQVAQLAGEARRLMLEYRFPYFGFMDDDLDARARYLQKEADRWRAALQECLQEGGA